MKMIAVLLWLRLLLPIPRRSESGASQPRLHSLNQLGHPVVLQEQLREVSHTEVSRILDPEEAEVAPGIHVPDHLAKGGGLLASRGWWTR